MAFLRAESAWFRANTWAALGSPDPPLSCQTICTGSLGTCLETEAHPATHRTARFPMGHTSQQLSQLLRESVRRKDLGTGGLGGGFSMELSKGPVPCVARECPCPSLIPQDTCIQQ